jgi:hypothetical protein
MKNPRLAGMLRTLTIWEGAGRAIGGWRWQRWGPNRVGTAVRTDDALVSPDVWLAT